MIEIKKLFDKNDIYTNIDYNSKTYLLRRVYVENIFPYIKMFIVAIILMVVVAIATAGYAYMVKPAMDFIFNSRNAKLLVIIPVAIAIIAVIKNVAMYFQNTLMSIISAKITRDIRLNLYSHLIKSDISTYNKTSSGVMISQMTNDVNVMTGMVNIIFIGLIREVITIFALVVVMFMNNYKLALISSLAFPLLILGVRYISKKLRQITKDNQAGLEKFISQMDDSLSFARLVKCYNAEEFEIGRMGKILDSLFDMQKKMLKISNLSSPMVEMVSVVSVAMIILYGGNQVVSGQATSGEFFSFFAAMTVAYRPAKTLSNLNITIQTGLIGTERVFRIIDEKPKIVSKNNAIEIARPSGNIEFRNVKFSYSDDIVAINNMSFRIKSGETIALVGHSGGGKSTIISLLLRFYDPNQGSIMVDGYDLRDLNIKSVRGAMSLVSQDVQLFDDTIFNNICYGKVDASEEEVIHAARLANCEEFIEKLPNKYQTQVGQNGVLLSGGQKQRISIARAILYDAPIILLDEATSALDSVSERLIKDAIKKVAIGRTCLIIAHRLSTILDADRIFVVKSGRIVESGEHNKLLSCNGEYAKLYNEQYQTGVIY